MARDSEVPTTQEIIEEWLVDYIYTSSLDEFGRVGTVRVNCNRDMIQGLMNMVGEGKQNREKLNQQVHKLRLMCNIADGPHYSPSDAHLDDPVHMSPLQEVLQQTPEWKQIFGDDDSFRSWLSNVKQQAVLVCCRSGNFEAAQQVYNRIWTGKKSSIVAKKKRSELQAVINSKDPEHPTLEEHPYKALAVQTHLMLRQLEDNPHHQPYLQYAALREQRRLCAADRPVSVGCQTSATPSLSTDSTLSPAEFCHLVKQSKFPQKQGKSFVLPDNWKQKWMNKVRDIGENKETYLNTIPSFEDSDLEVEELREPSSPTDDNPVGGTPPCSPATNNDNRDRRKLHKSPTAKTHNTTERPTPASPATVTKNKPQDECLAPTSPSKSKGTPQKRRLPNDEKDVSSPSKRREVDDRVAGDSSAVVTSSTPDRQNKSLQGYRYRRNLNREDRHATSKPTAKASTSIEDIFVDDENDKEEDSDEDMPRLAMPKKIPLRLSLAPPPRNRKISYNSGSTRTKWTRREEEDFYLAVIECGVGNWAEIKKQHPFPGRSNVNLKDKWRTMTRVGRVDELRHKFKNNP